MNSYDFTEYFYSTFKLFKENKRTITQLNEYQLWRDFDVPPEINFDVVPDEWKDFIQDPADVRDLIFCTETGLINIYEVIIYQYFRRLGVKRFKEDLLMAPIDKYLFLIKALHEHISTDQAIASTFHWFSIINSSSPHKKFQLEHQNMISKASEHEILAEATALFSNLYLQSFPLKIRKFLGEEYTPVDVVDFILDNVGYLCEFNLSEKKLLDPATGVGIFLTRALKRVFESAQGNSTDFLRDFVNNKALTGIEFKLFSAKASQLNFYLHFLFYASKVKGFSFDEQLPNIIHHGNALLYSNSRLSGLDKDLAVMRTSKYDYVVGNPPYLRIQNIKPDILKDYYVENYMSAEGRFDLSFLFIECGLYCLKPGGKLGYITTNKFMTVGAGQALRTLIQEKSEMEMLIDLSDTEFFESAVLPCIIVLRKGKENKNETFPYSIVTKLKGKGRNKKAKEVDLFKYLKDNSDKDILQSNVTISNQKGKLPVNVKMIRSLPPEANGDTWHFLTPMEEKIISALTKKANATLKDISEKIMVGIKSTADDVFIKPMSESFINERGFEKELIHPLLRGKNVQRWKINWSPDTKYDRYVLYPHIKVGGRLRAIELEKYPVTASYLKENYEELSKRHYVLEAGRNWYEIWVTQKPDYFEKPFKILTPDFSTCNTFGIDRNGFYLGTSALAVILVDQEEMFNYYILGLLNSSLLEFFHKFKSSTFIYAGRYRYWSSYMEKYPVYDYQISGEDKELCEDIANISLELSECEDGSERKEKQLNQIVYDLFRISENQEKHIRRLLVG